jgi:hypothetical protein
LIILFASISIVRQIMPVGAEFGAMAATGVGMTGVMVEVDALRLMAFLRLLPPGDNE